MDKMIKRHNFCFNSKDNGGESLCLVTEFFDNGDGIPDGVYIIQKLCLQSYSNAAEFLLSGLFTPENLRNLANQLESELIKVKSNGN